jgi:hypothetical protein
MNTRFVRGIHKIHLAIAAASMLALFAGSAAAAQLSGNIVHNGTGSGLYYVYVVRLGFSDFVAGTDILTSPGRWEVNGVPNGSYFVFAWRDVNHNFIPSRGEPVGFHGSILPQGVVVSNNQNQSGLDVHLTPVNVGAELKGRVIYSGPLSGRIWVVPHLGPELNALNVRGAPVTMLSPGNYEAIVLQSGEYYVTAWLDVNGNLLNDEGEPSGVSRPVTVEVTPGVTYAGVDVDIQLSTRTTAVESRTWTEIKSLYD